MHCCFRPSKPTASRTEKARNLTVSQRSPSGNPCRSRHLDHAFLLPARYGIAIVEIRGLTPRIPTLFCVDSTPGRPGARLLHPGRAGMRDYLSSTFAPAFSSWALSLSASSLLTPSLTG